MSRSKYNPHKELILSNRSNKLNNIIQKDLNKKDYNNIKELVEEKQTNIIQMKNNTLGRASQAFATIKLKRYFRHQRIKRNIKNKFIYHKIYTYG